MAQVYFLGRDLEGQGLFTALCATSPADILAYLSRLSEAPETPFNAYASHFRASTHVAPNIGHGKAASIFGTKLDQNSILRLENCEKVARLQFAAILAPFLIRKADLPDG